MTQFIIYDHNTHPVWADVYSKQYSSSGRTNGAYTYSVDIVEYHIPEIINYFSKSNKYKRILILTVGGLTPEITPPDIDLCIFYLHEHTDREIPRIEKLKQWYHGKVIFVIANKARSIMLTNMGHDCIFIPVAICVDQFSNIEKNDKYTDNRVVFFGNKYLKKFTKCDMLKDMFKRKGWVFDIMSSNKLNWQGELLSRDDMFNILAKYQYGIAVGRAALELGALGVKTMICAEKFGGIITNDDEFYQQLETNFVNSDLPTFSDSIRFCIDNFEKAIPKTHDVKDAVKYIAPALKKFA